MSVGYKIKNLLLQKRRAFSGSADFSIIFAAFFLLIVIMPIIISLYYSDYISYITYSREFNNPNKEIDVSKDPIQILNPFCYIPLLNSACTNEYKTIYGKDYAIYPKASYKIAGKIIAKNTSLYDSMSDISPIDIGLAWGKLAEPQYTKYLNFYSTKRIMWWNSNLYRIPLPREYIDYHLSHNHIIPANLNISNALMTTKLHDELYLEGFLVFVNRRGSSPWNSSLSRQDKESSGSEGIFSGSCEIFYVKKVRIGNNFYE